MQYQDDVYIERRINLLEEKISQREKSIDAMKKKMEQYINEIEYKKEQNRRLIVKKNQLISQLHLYRKAIQLSSKSSKTFLEQTKELFNQEDAKINEIEEKTLELQEILKNVKRYVPTIRERLSELQIQIPDFQADLLKYNFKDCMNTVQGVLNKKLLLGLRSTHFMEKQINEKMNERSKLMREVKALTPKVSMKLEIPTKSQIKRAPTFEYKKSKNFDTVFCNRMFNQAKSLLERYQFCINIIPTDDSQNTKPNDPPVIISRTPTAVARRNPRNRRGYMRGSINNYSSSDDFAGGINAYSSSPKGHASTRLAASPIPISARDINSNLAVSARSNRRSNRREQFKSMSISHIPNAESDFGNSNLQIKLSSLTDAIIKLNFMIQRVNKANDSTTKLKNEIARKIEETKKETSFTLKSLPNVSPGIAKIKELKKKIASESEEVTALKMDIPEQWNGSAQGLLKWQTQLLEQKEKMENSIGKQIVKQENQLKDLKVFTRRRVNTLTKLKQKK